MCGSENPNYERGKLHELVSNIVIMHAVGRFADVHLLLDEAPSFKRFAVLYNHEKDAFYDAVRRSEIEHKDLSHREYLFTALTLDDAAEETGMHGDERVTCRECRAWADHTH